MNIYQLLDTKPNNPHYLKRYVTFIAKCQNKDFSDQRCDKHHICPKAAELFPEFADLKKHHWNMILLPRRYHIVAHILLSKAYGGSQKFSLTILCKGNPKYRKSRFGDAQRDMIFAKDTITGECRVVTVEEFHVNQNLVGRQKGIPNNHARGKCAAVDLHGNKLGNISLNDPRWASGEIKHPLKGKKVTKIAAKCALTGISLGAVDRGDIRWTTGEIEHTGKGMKFSDTHKENIKKSHPCRKGKNNTFYGKTHRRESIEKALQNRDYTSITGENNKASKTIRINGMTFTTVDAGAAHFGMNSNTLRDYLKRRRKLNEKIWEAIYLPYLV